MSPTRWTLRDMGVRLDLAGLLLVACVLFFTSLGARDLWNPNEPIYGRAVVEMAERGDWLIPTVNGVVFAEKPILYYWSALISSRLIGGITELSLRVPLAIAGTISVVLLYFLVLPYAGRRRALMTALIFATLHQVVWASRAVQMDILVMATTLGVVLPLTRRLDFGFSAPWAWTLAGLSAGIGFASKGPVTWIVPALVMLAYALATSRMSLFLDRSIFLAAGIAIGVGGIWYFILLSQGETAFLHENLIRQNISRFTSAWDHVQPWWYYLKYIWLDYLPWALLLPAALWPQPSNPDEAKLKKLGWVWILAVIGFFSLSDSKRAPYLLPLAPAVAIVAGCVVDGLISGTLRRGARRAAVAAIALFGSIFLVAGIAIPFSSQEVPEDLQSLVFVVGPALAIVGLAILVGVALSRRRPALAPGALFVSMVAMYLLAAVLLLPSLNPHKSARVFAVEMNRHLEATGSPVVSYKFWNWRSGYAYYGERTIPNIKEAPGLEQYWRENDPASLIVENREFDEVESLLEDAVLVYERKIGSRTARLYEKSRLSP